MRIFADEFLRGRIRWALAVALVGQVITLWGLFAVSRIPVWLIWPFGALGLACTIGAYFATAQPKSAAKTLAETSHLGPSSTNNATTAAATENVPAGRRILLTEDSEDSQLLISTFLRQAGWHVTMARNGVEAVRLAGTYPFDLILMDVQMPEMDGHQATRELRRSGFTRPIVALTADTTPEARSACIAAGCTEYLSKPVQRARLLAACRSFLPDHDTKPQATSTEEPEPLRSTLSGDPRVARILNGFVSRLPQRVRQLAQCIDQGNIDGLKQAVHNLKGAGAGYGFAPLSESAERVEQALRGSREFAAIRRQVEDLIALIRQVEGYNLPAEAEEQTVTAA
jgi:CheY-like chemotaxis protein/HPt (histidine-containing phosphotransfer) domain-containing protein